MWAISEGTVCIRNQNGNDFWKKRPDIFHWPPGEALNTHSAALNWRHCTLALRRKRHLAPVFLPEKFQGQTSLERYSPRATRSWTRLSGLSTVHLWGKQEGRRSILHEATNGSGLTDPLKGFPKPYWELLSFSIYLCPRKQLCHRTVWLLLFKDVLAG